MKMGYVIFREDPNSHEEVYLEMVAKHDGKASVLDTEEVEQAAIFYTARDAYDWAQIEQPLLDNWRVGLR